MATSQTDIQEDEPLTMSTLEVAARRKGIELNSESAYGGRGDMRGERGRSDRYEEAETGMKLELEGLRDAIDRKIIEKDALYRNSRSSLSQTSTEVGIDPYSRVTDLEARLQRQLHEDTQSRIRFIEETIQERSQAARNLSRRSVEISLTETQDWTDACDSEIAMPSEGLQAKSRPKSVKRYEFLENRYSKFNTKSPWAKSTFSHDVRSMENQAYTYKRKQAGNSTVQKRVRSRKASVSTGGDTEFLRKVLAMADVHAKRCPELREELRKIRRNFGKEV